MELALTRDPEGFAELAAEFLAATPERNLLATVAHDSRTRSGGPAPLFACGRDERGMPVAAALRTPPWPMLACGFERQEDAEALLARWVELDPEPGGLGGEPATARALTAAWTKLTGGSTELLRTEAMHALETVLEPPRPAAGTLRLASPAERPLLVEWEQAFVDEVGIGTRDQAERAIDAALRARRLFVWDDGGPVSYLARSGPVAGAMRIGPVYTPPQLRNRGYATSAVAAVARRSLAEGSQRCLLFTNLANPTSNRIYASIGFVAFGDWEDHELIPPAAAAADRR